MEMQADDTPFRWWLIYGSGRSGTSYIGRWAARGAGREVSDWGLGAVVAPLEKTAGIDKDRFRRDLRANVLANARPVKLLPGGKSLDLAYKQAGLSRAEYLQLEKMFGPPERTIFCLRDPDGYMASAVKKFGENLVDSLRATYRRIFSEYRAIGGDVIHYGPHLITKIVAEFLAPLPVRDEIGAFVYRGEERPDLVTPQMRIDYETFREIVCPGVMRRDANDLARQPSG